MARRKRPPADPDAPPPPPHSPAVISAAVSLVDLLTGEGLITMKMASEILGPCSTSGKVRGPFCVANYCQRGVQGVILEGIHGPDGWLTSRPAVLRFLARLHLKTGGVVPAHLAGVELDPLGKKREAEAAFWAAESARIVEERKVARRKKRDEERAREREEREG